MKNWNMIGFVIFPYDTFQSYSFWADLFWILWFSLIFDCLNAGFVPCPGDKLIVPDSGAAAQNYPSLKNGLAHP